MSESFSQDSAAPRHLLLPIPSSPTSPASSLLPPRAASASGRYIHARAAGTRVMRLDGGAPRPPRPLSLTGGPLANQTFRADVSHADVPQGDSPPVTPRGWRPSSELGNSVCCDAFILATSWPLLHTPTPSPPRGPGPSRHNGPRTLSPTEQRHFLRTIFLPSV